MCIISFLKVIRVVRFRMLNILFIVTERNSANGVCANSVIQACLNRGYKVTCVTNREYDDPNDFISDDVKFYTVKPRSVYSICSYLNRSKISGLKKQLLLYIAFLINKFELLTSILTWPVISRGYSKRIYKLIQALHLKETFDIVVPIYTQIDTIIAANHLKRKYPDIKVVPYMLDSLAAGFGPKQFSKECVVKRGLKWEKKLFKDVDHIVMMKSSMDFYMRYKELPYMNKVSFLDIPLFVNNYKKTISSNETLIISYVGSIPAHIRNPKYFLDLFKTLDNTNIKLLVVGPSTCESLIQQYLKSDERIERIQRVSHSEALEIIEKSDILLNLGNNLTTMMPSKIFEYISTGKPIISTAPILNEPSISYLDRYGNACILYENHPIEYSVKKICNFISTAHTVDPSTLSDTFKLNKPETFVNLIENL